MPSRTPALIAENLHKEFRHRTADGPKTFRHWVESGFRRSTGAGNILALRDVNFSVAPGEMLGVVGRNGSGKSTLLRILGGVMQPSRGRVIRAAEPNGLLELNAGMHPDLTGRENIVIVGVLSGLLRSEVMERMEEIIDFAEIRNHIDDPVRTYSAGMKLRLGFSVAVHVDPRILLIDEVLSVGDLAFQRKCLDRIQTFKEQGCAIVLISHDIGQVRAYCDRALWLDRGVARVLGSAEEVTQAYQQAMEDQTRRLTDTGRADRVLDGDVTLRAGENWLGSQQARIESVRLLDGGGRLARSADPGMPLTVEIDIEAAEPLPGAHVSISLADRARQVVLDVNTEMDRAHLPPLSGRTTVAVTFDRIDLTPGEYRLSAGIWAPDWHHAYDLHLDAYVLPVSGHPLSKAPFLPPRRWSLRETSVQEREGAPAIGVRQVR